VNIDVESIAPIRGFAPDSHDVVARSTSIDHGSPSTSMAALIAHSDVRGR
jgi:hypothetical protein